MKPRPRGKGKAALSFETQKAQAEWDSAYGIHILPQVNLNPLSEKCRRRTRNEADANKAFNDQLDTAAAAKQDLQQ